MTKILTASDLAALPEHTVVVAIHQALGTPFPFSVQDFAFSKRLRGTYNDTWLVTSQGEPSIAQREMAQFFTRYRDPRVVYPLETPGVRQTPRTAHPKCEDCGHSVRSHNDLGYCQTGAGTPRSCGCAGYDDGLRRQPDGSLARPTEKKG